MLISGKTLLIAFLALLLGGAAASAVSSLGAGAFWSSVVSGIASVIGNHITSTQTASAAGKITKPCND